MGITFEASAIHKDGTYVDSYLTATGIGAHYQCGYNQGKYITKLRLNSSHYINSLSLSFKKIYASTSNINFQVTVSKSNDLNNYNTTSNSLGSTTFSSGSSNSTSVNSGNPITITFNNYYGDSDIWVYITPVSTSTSSGAMTFYAAQNSNSPMTFSATDYTKLTYNLNGGSNGPTSPQYVLTNNSIKIPSGPTRGNKTDSSNFTITGNANGGVSNTKLTATKTTTTKYAFTNWTTTAGTALKAGASATFTVASSTLTAQWSETTTTNYTNNTLASLGSPSRNNSTQKGYTVTFYGNNGYVDIEQPGLQTLSKTATDTIKYTFKGWGSSSNSTTILTPTTSFTEDTTVYAVWDSTITRGQVTFPTGYRTSYEFVYWGTSNSSTSGYSPGIYVPNGNMTLYAIWKPKGSFRLYDSEWKIVQPYMYINNKWTQVIPYIYINGEWKILGG